MSPPGTQRWQVQAKWWIPGWDIDGLISFMTEVLTEVFLPISYFKGERKLTPQPFHSEVTRVREVWTDSSPAWKILQFSNMMQLK